MQKPKPLISIIIPAYNAEQTIGDCLQAALNSTFDGFEVIVVDDGSTDRTAGIAGKRAGVRVILQPNAGSAAAKNRGAAEAAGQYFYFLDSDVLIRRDTIEKMLETAGQHEVDLVVGRYDVQPLNPGLSQCYKALFDYVYYIPKGNRDRVYMDGQIGGGGDFISRAAFEKIGGFDTSFAGASVEREDLYIRFYDSGFHSAANPLIAVRHFYPGVAGLLRNSAARTFATVKLLHGRKTRFTYIPRFQLVSQPVCADMAIACFPVFDFGQISLASGMIFFIAFLYLSREFLMESVIRLGAWRTLRLIPLHLVVLNTVLASATAGLAAASVKRLARK